MLKCLQCHTGAQVNILPLHTYVHQFKNLGKTGSQIQDSPLTVMTSCAVHKGENFSQL